MPDYKNPQALNRYSYVLNNPLRYNDPTGQCPSFIFGNPVTSGVENVTNLVVNHAGEIAAANACLAATPAGLSDSRRIA